MGSCEAGICQWGFAMHRLDCFVAAMQPALNAGALMGGFNIARGFIVGA
jgi:hypothetical protein